LLLKADVVAQLHRNQDEVGATGASVDAVGLLVDTDRVNIADVGRLLFRFWRDYERGQFVTFFPAENWLLGDKRSPQALDGLALLVACRHFKVLAQLILVVVPNDDSPFLSI